MKSPDKEAAEKMMMRVRDKLQTYSHYDFQAGIGSLVDSMKKLPVSCEGARQALDYSNIYGRNHVTMIENVLVLEEREPIRLEKEMAEVLRYSDSSGFLDIRQAIGNYMNRLMIASKGSFFLYSKGVYQAAVGNTDLMSGNPLGYGRLFHGGSLFFTASVQRASGAAGSAAGCMRADKSI